MKKPNKKIKASVNPRVSKKRSVKSDASKNKETGASVKNEVLRKNLEKKVNKQSSELENKSKQLKQGIDREIIAQEQIHIRNKAMDSALDGIFIIDAQNDNFPILYANLSYQKLIGYTKNEVIGEDYFHLYGPKADLRVLNVMKKSMRSGDSFHGELLNFKRGGKKFWSLLRLTPVRDKKGNVTHYVGIQTDTTLMKQKNMEIEEKREELLHVTRVGKLAEFVSSLAHEISQPLTAILSYAQASQRLLADREPELKEILGHIIDDDQRAAEVIKRLRLLLKKNKPVIESIDVNTLITDTVQLIQTHITLRHIAITFDLDNNLPAINGDRIQLQQVILNLLSNSLEAMEENKDSREIMIKTLRKDLNSISVEVKDSGSGISVKNMNKLFTHFFTSKINGLGMGLPISRSIIEGHGGRLNAKNNSKRGATFSFTVPIFVKDAHG